MLKRCARCKRLVESHAQTGLEPARRPVKAQAMLASWQSVHLCKNRLREVQERELNASSVQRRGMCIGFSLAAAAA